MTVSGDDGAVNGYSVPDPEKCRLARAWCAARYEVLLPGGALPLRIGEPAAALEARLPADAYLWITAWNPPLAARTAALNRRADQRLLAHLRERGRVPVPARASDGAGGWHEPGWLVPDLGRDEADALARAFEQGGILHWRRGQPVRLRLMWPPPADPCPLPGTAAVDWAG
jgi:hypothetical protein